MYDAIRTHPTVREKLAAELVRDGVITQEEGDAILQAVYDRLDKAKAGIERGLMPTDSDSSAATPARELDLPVTQTAVAAEKLLELNDSLLTWPEWFKVNPRLAKQLERRREALGPS